MEQRIGIERMEEAINLFGSFDENIRLLESEFQVTVVNRGGELVISGEPENVMLAEKAVTCDAFSGGRLLINSVNGRDNILTEYDMNVPHD